MGLCYHKSYFSHLNKSIEFDVREPEVLNYFQIVGLNPAALR